MSTAEKLVEFDPDALQSFDDKCIAAISQAIRDRAEQNTRRGTFVYDEHNNSKPVSVKTEDLQTAAWQILLNPKETAEVLAPFLGDKSLTLINTPLLTHRHLEEILHRCLHNPALVAAMNLAKKEGDTLVTHDQASRCVKQLLIDKRSPIYQQVHIGDGVVKFNKIETAAAEGTVIPGNVYKDVIEKAIWRLDVTIRDRARIIARDEGSQEISCEHIDQAILKVLQEDPLAAAGFSDPQQESGGGSAQ